MKQLILLLILLTLWRTVHGLSCMQCDTHNGWYSEEEQERRVAECQRGTVEMTPCTNRTHTHCIVSWFRSGGKAEKTVTERKCGGVDEVTGCTLYNSKISRRVRHLLSKDKEHRRETESLFVEVCSESCTGGDCVNAAPLPIFSTVTMVLLTALYVR